MENIYISHPPHSFRTHLCPLPNENIAATIWTFMWLPSSPAQRKQTVTVHVWSLQIPSRVRNQRKLKRQHLPPFLTNPWGTQSSLIHPPSRSLMLFFYFAGRSVSEMNHRSTICVGGCVPKRKSDLFPGTLHRSPYIWHVLFRGCNKYILLERLRPSMFCKCNQSKCSASN